MDQLRRRWPVRMGAFWTAWMLLPFGFLHALDFLTLHFEGTISSSGSTHVAAGDRFVGQIVYQFNAIDLDPDPTAGYYVWEHPASQPVGWQYTTGNLAYSTSIASELVVIDLDFVFDLVAFSSDAMSGPGFTPPYGIVYLEDDMFSVLKNDRPPRRLNLAQFSLALFEGGDGTATGVFSGEIDRLWVIPEPNMGLALIIGTWWLTLHRRSRSGSPKSGACGLLQ